MAMIEDGRLHGTYSKGLLLGSIFRILMQNSSFLSNCLIAFAVCGPAYLLAFGVLLLWFLTVDITSCILNVLSEIHVFSSSPNIY